MAEQKNAYVEARLALSELPGNLHYKTLQDNIVTFERRPSTEWRLYEVSYEDAVEAIVKGAKALTHGEAYEEMLEGSFDREAYMLMALDLSEDPHADLEEILSEYNTEAGTAWVSCQDNDPRWAVEEETGKVLTCDDKGVFHID